MKNYSEWRVCQVKDGLAVYRLKNYRKGIRPGNIIIYDIVRTFGEAAELCQAINQSECKDGK